MHFKPQRQQFPILDIVGDYVQKPLGLPVVPRLHNQRIVNTADSDCHLVFDLLQGAVSDHLTFPHDFHGVNLGVVLLVWLIDTWLLLFHFDHVAEGASTNHVQDLKVRLGYFALDAELGFRSRLVERKVVDGSGRLATRRWLWLMSSRSYLLRRTLENRFHCDWRALRRRLWENIEF